jgi:Sulfotransferase domain
MGTLRFKARLAGRFLYLCIRKPSFRVGFLIAGVQKAGTSSLYRLLHQHPNIGLSSAKEVKFFDNDIIVDWSKPTYNWYHSYFPRKPGKTILGEATPNYIYWPSALERIKVYNPDVKLIFLFRDPIDRAYSAWCHQKGKGREPLTFADAIRSGRARITGERDSASRYFSYVEKGFYAQQLSRALELFPKANILTLESQELNLDPSLLMERIGPFLGLEATNQTFTPVHENTRSQDANALPPSAADVKLLADLFAPELEKFSKIVDLSIDHWPTCRVLSGSASAEEVAADLAEPGFAKTSRQPAGSDHIH